MKELRFLLSLMTKDNDFQVLQAADAEEAARRVGAKLEIIYAENDSITQSQQLLQRIQSPHSRPDAIVIHPVGTSMPQVARAAMEAGVGWAMLSRVAEYTSEFRAKYRSPVFSISSDHVEIGRTQGRQFGALLPNGGIVLYVLGASASTSSGLRAQGMNETRPANIEIKTVRASWTEESGYKAVSSWLRINRGLPLGVVGCQNDVMALGARRAFGEAVGGSRNSFPDVPFTGCDGGPQTGQEWVRKGWLAATVIMPPNAGRAVEMMAEALRDTLPPPPSIIVPISSFPPVEDLVFRRGSYSSPSQQRPH